MQIKLADGTLLTIADFGDAFIEIDDTLANISLVYDKITKANLVAFDILEDGAVSQSKEYYQPTGDASVKQSDTYGNVIMTIQIRKMSDAEIQIQENSDAIAALAEALG